MVAFEEARMVREYLTYDPQTGEFRFRKCASRSQRWNTRWAGKAAGGPHPSGYWSIHFLGNKHMAHRLAWLYIHGEWPSLFVDHKNLNRRDNRLENLRLATFAENSANASLRSDSTSGFRGVWFRADRNRWCAQIHFKGKKRHLGSFLNPVDAHHAYARAARETYGEFCPMDLMDAA